MSALAVRMGPAMQKGTYVRSSVIMFGAVAATALTLVAVPPLYYEFFNDRVCPLRAEELESKNEGRGKK